MQAEAAMNSVKVELCIRTIAITMTSTQLDPDCVNTVCVEYGELIQYSSKKRNIVSLGV